MSSITFAIRCKWTTRHLQRYIDMDPAANLSAQDITRVRAHLAECEKCRTSVDDYKRMNAALRWIGKNTVPEEASLKRLKEKLNQITLTGGEE